MSEAEKDALEVSAFQGLVMAPGSHLSTLRPTQGTTQCGDADLMWGRAVLDY